MLSVLFNKKRMILHRSHHPPLYSLRHSRAGGNPGMFKAQQNVTNLSALCMRAATLDQRVTATQYDEQAA